MLLHDRCKPKQKNVGAEEARRSRLTLTGKSGEVIATRPVGAS